MEYKRLGDIAVSTQYGYTSEETSFAEGKYKYLRITDIVPYFVDFEKVPYCSIPESKVSQYLVKEGDILVARTGATTGYNYVVGKNIENTVFASYLIRFKVNEEVVMPTFLKYIMKSQMYYGFINNYIGGSAQPGMNAKVFCRFCFPLPSLPLQRRIASILSAYDNLIEANSRRIKILEQMAENLYKEWFVRFRFPNYQNTPIENGIPKGWKVERYKEMLTIKYGKGLETTKLTSTGYPVFGSNGIIGFYTKYMYEKPQVLISCRGASSGVVNISLPYSFITSNSLICERTNPNLLTFEYLKYYFLNSNLVQYQTGSAQPQITINNIEKLKFVVPNIELQEEFARLVRRIDDKILTLQRQSANLTRQRDLLLPRLMSGQLTPLTNQ